METLLDWSGDEKIAKGNVGLFLSYRGKRVINELLKRATFCFENDDLSESWSYLDDIQNLLNVVMISIDALSHIRKEENAGANSSETA